jgi:hypothetical protein
MFVSIQQRIILTWSCLDFRQLDAGGLATAAHQIHPDPCGIVNNRTVLGYSASCHHCSDLRARVVQIVPLGEYLGFRL